MNNKLFEAIKTLARGNIAAKLASILSIPVITRLYSPQNMGDSATYLAITLAVAPFLSLRLPIAIPLQQTAISAHRIAVAALATTLITSTFLALLVAAISTATSTPKIPQLLIPLLGALILAILEIITYINLRQRKYTRHSTTTATQAFATEGTKIIWGMFAPTSAALIISHITGTLSAITINRHRFLKTIQSLRHRHNEIYKTFQRQIPTIRSRTPSQVFLAISSATPLVYCSQYYSGETTGQVALALTTLAMPTTLIGTAISQGYYAEAAALRNSRNTRTQNELTLSVLKRTTPIGLGFSLTFAAFAPELFPSLFGPAWHEAGQYAKMLAPAYALQFIAAPVMQYYTLTNKERMYLSFNVLRLSLVLVSAGVAVFVNATPADYLALQTTALVAVYSIVLAHVSIQIMQDPVR